MSGKSYKDKEKSDIQILNEMLKEEVILPLTDKNKSDKNKRSNRQVILKEPDANYSISIDGMPSDDEVIIIKADAFKAPKDVFRNSKHECKRADFVIITHIPQVLTYAEVFSRRTVVLGIGDTANSQ